MKRTEVVCILEGDFGSTDHIFASAFKKKLNPKWLRPTCKVRFEPCGSRNNVISRFSDELKSCIRRGSESTLIVLADVDDDCIDSEELKMKFWDKAKDAGVTHEMFEKAVFIFPKDRIENWIQFLNTGVTNENIEAPRVTRDEARAAASKLVEMYRNNSDTTNLPPSLTWSCQNWKKLTDRMD